MKLHDTLTGQKRDFAPTGDTVKLYVCGVSPYSSAHVGHALSYVFFDVMRRYLEYRGYRVRHIQNFTDVEDNIIAAAQRAGTTIWDLTEGYIREYFEDMDALGIQRAHEYPKATEMVPQIVEMVQGLIDKGFAYLADGDVYFRVTSVADYGKLSHRTLDGMMAGARVEVVAGKEHPWTSPCGRPPSPASRPGTARGAPAVQAGTSSAAPCPFTSWAQAWTSTAGGPTWFFPTMRTRSPRASPTRAKRRWPTSGCTTAISAWTRTR